MLECTARKMSRADILKLCAHVQQENEGQADRMLPARDLSDPAAAACALQDISLERMAALDISIEEDAEALERLRLVCS